MPTCASGGMDSRHVARFADFSLSAGNEASAGKVLQSAAGSERPLPTIVTFATRPGATADGSTRITAGACAWASTPINATAKTPRTPRQEEKKLPATDGTDEHGWLVGLVTCSICADLWPICG